MQITKNLWFYNVAIKCHHCGKWQPKTVVRALDIVSSKPQAGPSACPAVPDRWPSHSCVGGVPPHSCSSPHGKALRRLRHPPQQLFCSIEAICKKFMSCLEPKQLLPKLSPVLAAIGCFETYASWPNTSSIDWWNVGLSPFIVSLCCFGLDPYFKK